VKLKKLLILISSLSIFLVSCTQQNNTTEATILHWNDFHAANLPYKTTQDSTNIKVGGYANLAGYLDSLRRVYPNAVTMNAGDDFQGSPVSSLTKGRSQILILNQVGLDVFTIGNHEFDYGLQNLKDNIELADFPVVSSNIKLKKTGKFLVEPYKIIQSGEAKIGVIGVVLETLKSSSLPKNVKDIKVLKAAEQVRKYADSLGNRVDLTVVLSHQGFHPDSVLATKLDRVDAIIGGHSHTWLSEPVRVNDILICQVGSRGERIGLLNATIDTVDNTIKYYNYKYLETVVGKVEPDPAVKKVVDSLDAQVAERMDQKIGVLEADWERRPHSDSNIGNWFTDALREHFKTDIAFQNSGGIRKDLAAGPITIRDIWEISPFSNTIEIIKVRGDTLRQMMIHRVQDPHDLLQTSGMKRVYNSETDSLHKLTINGQKVDDDQFYTIAINNYIVGHAKRFFGISADKLQIRYTGIIGRDVLIKDVKEADTIKSKVENRIVDLANKN